MNMPRASFFFFFENRPLNRSATKKGEALQCHSNMVPLCDKTNQILTRVQKTQHYMFILAFRKRDPETTIGFLRRPLP